MFVPTQLSILFQWQQKSVIQPCWTFRRILLLDKHDLGILDAFNLKTIQSKNNYDAQILKYFIVMIYAW